MVHNCTFKGALNSPSIPSQPMSTQINHAQAERSEENRNLLNMICSGSSDRAARTNRKSIRVLYPFDPSNIELHRKALKYKRLKQLIPLTAKPVEIKEINNKKLLIQYNHNFGFKIPLKVK